MNVRGLAIALLLSGVAVVVSATPAFAHAELVGSDPAQNATVAVVPQQVQLTFNEPVTVAENPVTVTGPEGVSWTVGQPSITGAVVTVPVQASGPAGGYTLTYRVLSSDGDVVDGSVAFTLASAVPGPTASSPTSSAPPTTEVPPTSTASAAPAVGGSSGGVPVWVWVLGGVVLVVVGVVVALRLGRGRKAG
jgi:methionine-rich copper-binding protein CopC